MSAINYSKWDHIEISDDEDDTHPNVDTPSLFKWRHEARLQREEEERREKQQKEAASMMRRAAIAAGQQKLEKTLAETGSASAEAQAEGIKEKLDELKVQEEEFRKKEEELARFQKAHPKWNVDNISKDKQSKTIINKPKKQIKDMTEDEKIQDMNVFFKKHGDAIKQFGFLSDYEASRKYLMDNIDLVCDHLASYLVVFCVDLEVEEKHELMKRVAHQTIVAQYIMELAKSLDRDPRDCVAGFFARIKTAEKQYVSAFDDELKSFIKRVEGRAQVRLEDARKQVEEDERKARLGPGGLDPLEILETLPPKIKEAFTDQNTPLLKQGFDELSPEDQKYHFDRCVASGLWVPEGGAQEAEEGAAAEDNGAFTPGIEEVAPAPAGAARTGAGPPLPARATNPSPAEPAQEEEGYCSLM